jgi:site-specific DNA recombinase
MALAADYNTPLGGRGGNAGGGQRALGCGRVSTDEQLEGFGLEVQERQITEHVERRGYRLVGMEADDFSGHTLERPAFSRVLELARAQAFDVLVVPRLDRLARKNYLRRLAEAQLEEYGITVEFTEQHFDTSPAGRFQKGIMGEFAEFEAALILERTMDGRRAKAEGAKGGAPRMPVGVAGYGLRMVSRAEAAAIPEFAGRSGELLVVPAEAAFVAEMFQRAAAGESLYAIAKWADGSGHPPRRGGLWHPSSIRTVLQNPAYYGEAAFGKWSHKTTSRLAKSKKRLAVRRRARPESEWSRIPCPAIVSRELWDAAQERIQANRGGKPSNRWPLAGVVSCSACTGHWGQPLCAYGQEQKGNRRYVCSSCCRKEFKYCHSFHGADALEENARQAIALALSPGRLAALAREEAERANETAGDPAERERALLAQIAALDDEIESIFKRAKLGFDPSFIQKKVTAINDQRADLEKQLAEVKAQAARLRDPEEAARAADAVAAKLAVGLEVALADPARFKALARLLLAIRIYPDRQPKIDVRVPTSLQ